MKSLVHSLSIAAAITASTTTALATFNPISNGPAYAVGIPSSSSISASAQGGIYLQLTAPTSYQWVGLGIGEAMAGATIFVMYADGNGNVTVSARSGRGHIEPKQDTALQQNVQLLEGSGIVDGMMVANVLCSSCTLKSAKDDTASPFIAAWNEAAAIDSTSQTAIIRQHGDNSYRQFTFDLTAAAVTNDANPFVTAASPSPSGGSHTSSGASPTSSGSASGSASPTASSGSSGSISNGSSSGGTSSVVVSGDAKDVINYQKAHGIIMGVTVVLLFPIGAMFMRLGGSAWGHGAIQALSLACLIAGFGLGVELAKKTSLLYNNAHTIFGTVILALFILQPFGGLAHHLQYRKTNTRNPISHIHIWLGRVIMILAIVNGGLGLKLAANTTGGEIAYGVVAGVVGLAYVVLVAFKRKGTNRAVAHGTTSRMWGSKEGMVRDASS